MHLVDLFLMALSKAGFSFLVRSVKKKKRRGGGDQDVLGGDAVSDFKEQWPSGKKTKKNKQ